MPTTDERLDRLRAALPTVGLGRALDWIATLEPAAPPPQPILRQWLARLHPWRWS